MKSKAKIILFLIIAIMILVPFTRANATEGETIGETEATIKGTNYEIDADHKVVILNSNANVQLIGNANNYSIDVEENATNVIITLSNYHAVTGGWVNSINLKQGSSAKIVLVGVNSLEAGSEASAIRVPEGTSLIIEGKGKLTAKISNGGSSASSAVIGSQYDLNCGNITINSGTISTEYSGGGTPSGIGTGDWNFNANDVKGNITINGGNITTGVFGSAKGGSVMNIIGSGNAIIHTEKLDGIITNFNGVIFVSAYNTGEARGNATITEDLVIPSNYSFTVAPSATLNIPENVTLTNKGNMDVLGSIMNNGKINNTGTLTNNGTINSDTEIQGVTGNDIFPASYEYLAGSNLNYIKDEDTIAMFRINADYSLFQTGGKVYVNDKLLEEAYYTSEPGSTIIKLKEEYMNSLSAGSYTLKVVFSNKAVAKTSFTVANKVVPQSNTSPSDTPKEVKNPETYDSILVYISMFGLCVACLVGIYIKRKKF